MSVAVSGPSRFRPIDLATLTIDTSPDFSLYLKTGTDSYLLFRDRELEFTSVHRDRLVANQVTGLYIDEADRGRYFRYVGRHLGAVVGDPAVPPETKSAALYSVSTQLVQDALGDPRAGDLVARTEGVAGAMIDLLRTHAEALHLLVGLMAADYSVCTHSMNVSVLSVMLAAEAGITSRDELQDLAVGTLLHDIGKSGLSPQLLRKPGSFDFEEMELMKQHVAIGEALLRERTGFDRNRMLPVSLHHEKLDGSGYPRGLLLTGIHPFGRIAAIADCFDAMTTDRSYQRAFSAFGALSLMRGRLRARYDQQLLERFIRLIGRASHVGSGLESTPFSHSTGSGREGSVVSPDAGAETFRDSRPDPGACPPEPAL